VLQQQQQQQQNCKSKKDHPTQNKTNNPTKPSPRQNTDREKYYSEKICEDFVRNVKSQDADNVGCGIGY
jgi:hypothetical protein